MSRVLTPLDKLKTALTGKKVLVFGLGLLGGAAQSAAVLGSLGCQLKITDLKSETELDASLSFLHSYSPTLRLGQHHALDIEWADLILRNPAIPWQHELLNLARKLHKPIVMDADLFVRYCGLPTVGISGTRGKSTTTLMTHAIFKTAISGPIFLGGNLPGQPLLPLLSQIEPNSQAFAILELSSWQLQAFHAQRLSVNFAALTNLYPDHLNYYPDLESYYHDKTALFTYQHASDHLCLNQAVPQFAAFAQSARSQVHWYQASGLPASIQLQVPGDHNRANAAAAMCLARAAKIDESAIIYALNHFEGLPFRLQPVRTLNHIQFINDTTSTTPIATITALQALKKPPILIAGGYDKNLPLESLARAIQREVKALILLSGNGTSRLLTLLPRFPIELETTDLIAAVTKAFAIARAGDTILFSPGFASFGLFRNEFDRGEKFDAAVQAL